MASSDIPSKEKWEKAQTLLDIALKKEIGVMREILANLHEEELALLENAPTRWTQVIADRSELIVQLSSLRTLRHAQTKALEELATLLEKKELFPSEDDTSVDIQSKLDQVIALIERINLQNCRNDALFDQTKQKGDIPLHCKYPHPLNKPRRKNAVATYTKKRS